MYIPSAFQMDDAAIERFIHDHSFGVLISAVNETPAATHIPFFYNPEERVLLAHLAKANPQWRTLHGQSALVVFQGPHAYISPSWYETPASVPTWNYVAVHVYGTCQVVDSQQELAEILEKTIRFYEPDSLLPTEADEPFYRKMMQAIVGIRIRITHMEGAAKLSQNKSPDVQQRVIARLRESGDAIAQRVADWMQHQWHRTDGT